MQEPDLFKHISLQPPKISEVIRPFLIIKNHGFIIRYIVLMC